MVHCSPPLSQVLLADRDLVEQGAEQILETAKEQEVAFLVVSRGRGWRCRSRSGSPIPPRSYRSNMEMSGYMSDYICSFTNRSSYVTAYIFLTANADRRAVSFTLAE